MKKQAATRKPVRANRRDSSYSTAFRRKSSEAFRATQARYRMLLEQSVQPIYMYDATSKRILEANPTFLDLLGYTADEVRKLTLYDIVAHDKEIIDHYLQQILSSGPIVLGDKTWRRKDGALVNVDVNLSKIRQGRRDIVFVIARYINESKLVEHEKQRRANVFAALYETTRDLAEQQDLPSLLQAIVNRATALFGSPGGAIYLIDEKDHALHVAVTKGVEVPDGTRLDVGEGMAGRVAQTHQPMLTDDYETWNGRSAKFEKIPVAAVVQAPMLYRGQLIGVLSVHERGESKRKFTEYDLRHLSLFARQAAIAVHNTRLLGETRRRADEFAALYETAHDLSAQHELNQILDTIVERAIKLLGTSSGFIYLYNAAQGDLELTLTKGITSPRKARVEIGGGIAGRVAQTLQPLIVKDYQNWEHRLPQYTSARYRSILEVPMTSGGELIGVLGVNELGESTRQFNEDDVRLLSLFAAQASIAVYNARLYEKVRTGRESLQVLSQRVIRAQETERRQIARELHDEIGQALTGVQLNLQTVQHFLEGDARESLKDSMLTIERVLQQARDLSLNLRPSVLDDFGLVAALRWLVKRRTKVSGPAIEFTADPFETRLSEDIETACFRVAQEALTNVVRHARASHVSIELHQRDEQLQLLIRDDGVGFDVSKAMDIAKGGASMGLLGLRERVLLVGGRIEIESVLGQGTALLAYFPIRPLAAFVERRTRRRIRK